MKFRKVLAMAAASVALTVSAGKVVYRCDFTPSEMGAWQLGRIGSVESSADGNALKVVSDPAQAHNKVFLPIDLKPYANKVLRMSCRMKLDGVTKPPHDWNGSKFMLTYRAGENGRLQYLHSAGKFGDTDWIEMVYNAIIGENPLEGKLNLGLEESQGTIRFADLRIEELEVADLYPRVAPEGYRPVYTDRVNAEPRRRGAMSPSVFSAATISRDLPDLRNWGANLIRWQLIRNWSKTDSDQDIGDYLSWVDARIPEIRQVLDKAHELDMKVVLDLHVPPGGRRAGGEMNMFYERKFADAFLEAWRKLAGAVKGHPALYGYDLINEPVQQAGVPIDYLRLQFEAAGIVREIDPDTPVIIESNDWDAPGAFTYLTPVPLKDVIYQVHMYQPGSYTHQGVHRRPSAGPYPGQFNTGYYDKEALRRELQPVRDFQLKYGAKIYVGEFSVIRWAKGGARYLEDCISIFEQYGWDWSYHAFREWSGWSVEHSADRDNPEPVADTDRKQVLLRYMKRNQPSERKNP